jgi:hypothetical protein
MNENENIETAEVTPTAETPAPKSHKRTIVAILTALVVTLTGGFLSLNAYAQPSKLSEYSPKTYTALSEAVKKLDIQTTRANTYIEAARNTQPLPSGDTCVIPANDEALILLGSLLSSANTDVTDVTGLLDGTTLVEGSLWAKSDITLSDVLSLVDKQNEQNLTLSNAIFALANACKLIHSLENYENAKTTLNEVIANAQTILTNSENKVTDNTTRETLSNAITNASELESLDVNANLAEFNTALADIDSVTTEITNAIALVNESSLAWSAARSGGGSRSGGSRSGSSGGSNSSGSDPFDRTPDPNNCSAIDGECYPSSVDVEYYDNLYRKESARLGTLEEAHAKCDALQRERYLTAWQVIDENGFYEQEDEYFRYAVWGNPANGMLRCSVIVKP